MFWNAGFRLFKPRVSDPAVHKKKHEGLVLDRAWPFNYGEFGGFTVAWCDNSGDRGTVAFWWDAKCRLHADIGNNDDEFLREVLQLLSYQIVVDKRPR